MMPFVIKRRSVDGGELTSPIIYKEKQDAVAAIPQILFGYTAGRKDASGYEAQHDYWWARNTEGEVFRFTISGI